MSAHSLADADDRTVPAYPAQRAQTASPEPPAHPDPSRHPRLAGPIRTGGRRPHLRPAPAPAVALPQPSPVAPVSGGREAPHGRHAVQVERGSVLLTISLDLDGIGDQHRLLQTLREVVAAAGSGHATALAPPAPPAPAASTAADTPASPAAIHRPARPPLPPVLIRSGTRKVTRDGDLVPLTRLEYELLVFFVRHPNRVFTRQQLLTYVWGHSFAGGRTVDVHIRRVRMKLGSDHPLLTTVRGVGYRLADDAPVRLLAS